MNEDGPAGNKKSPEEAITLPVLVHLLSSLLLIVLPVVTSRLSFYIFYCVL